MIKCALSLLIIATCIVGIFADDFCEKQRKLDSECAKYCYQVAKPLIQMAPVCHQKDAEIKELNTKIANLTNEIVVYKQQEKKSLEEENKYNVLNDKFIELHKKLGAYEEREKKSLEEGTKCNELNTKLDDLQNKLAVYEERERKSKEEENNYNVLNDKFIELHKKLGACEERDRKSLEEGNKCNVLINNFNELNKKLAVYEYRDRESLEEGNKYNQLNDKFNELNKKHSAYEYRQSKRFEEGTKCNELNATLAQLPKTLLNLEERVKKGIEEINLSNQLNVQLGEVQEKLADCEEREKKSKENNSKAESSLKTLLEEYRVKLSNLEKTKEDLEKRIPQTNCTIYASPGVDTIRMIEIEGIEAFSVRCVNDLNFGPGWMLIQKRTGALDNNYHHYTWSKYRNGFGGFNAGFFIGLEKLYRLTNVEPHELYIDMEDFDGNKKFAHYDNFRVGNESEKYPLKDLGNYTPDSNAGDALRDNNNMKFSTYQRDNDNSPDDCATKYLSGWWHNDCTKANLNGNQYGINEYKENGIWWHSHVALKNVRMLIRPKVKK